MRRVVYIAGLLLVTVVTTLVSCGRTPSEEAFAKTRETSAPNVAAPRPNILFLLTDDQGIGDLSLHGNDSIRTPNLDALMLSGARFDRFYVDPVCAPSRASFLSGKYAARTGAIYVTRRRETMDANVTTLAEYLKSAGYRTGMFGKWHNGATFPYHPAAQGFEEFLGFTMGHFNDYFNGVLQDELDRPVPFSGDLTDILTDSAATWMTGGSLGPHGANNKPFFAMLAYQGPHTPVQVAEDHWAEVRKRGLTPYNTGIYAMVESLDEQVGRLLDRLRASGQLDNTIVVYASDNGPNGDRYRMGLRGIKTDIDEGGVRSPFVIRLPGADPANGQRFATPAAHIDLLPTVLDYLDLPVPDDLDGRSLLPVLRGDGLPHRYLYTFRQAFVFDAQHGSMRDSHYLYVSRPTGAELYDLIADPGQARDLAAADPGRIAQLRASYEAVARGVHDESLVAPPIDLSAGPGVITLAAHEGTPGKGNGFSARGGFANDYVVDASGEDVLSWPIVVRESGAYALTLRYGLSGTTAREVGIHIDGGSAQQLVLPAVEARRLPVADRIDDRHTWPYAWAEARIAKLTLTQGATRLRVSAPAGTGLTIKEVLLTRLKP